MDIDDIKKEWREYLANPTLFKPSLPERSIENLKEMRELSNSPAKIIAFVMYPYREIYMITQLFDEIIRLREELDK